MFPELLDLVDSGEMNVTTIKLIAERRHKLAQLRAAGPAFPNDFRRDALAAELLTMYAERDNAWLEAHPVQGHVGGRIMFKRILGKARWSSATATSAMSIPVTFAPRPSSCSETSPLPQPTSRIRFPWTPPIRRSSRLRLTCF